MMKHRDRRPTGPAPVVPAVPQDISRIGGFVLLIAWTLLAFILAVRIWPGWVDCWQNMLRGVALAEPFYLAGFVSAIAGHLAGLGQLAVMLVGAYGAGGPLARVLSPSRDPADQLPLRLAAGWSVVSLVQQGLGFSGLLFPAALKTEAAAWVLAGALAAVREKPWRAVSRLAPGSLLPTALTVGMLGVYYLLTRLPDTHEDPMAYHFAAPEQYLALHRIVSAPWHLNWHFPLGAEMVFMLNWHLGGIALTKLTNIGFLLTTLFLTRRLAALILPAASVAGPAWAAFWVTSAGFISDMCWQGKNDLGTLTFVTAGALYAALGMAGNRRGWGAAAWFLGAATGAKLTAGFFVGGIVAAALVVRPALLDFRLLALCAVSAALPLLSWLAESWLFLGNPFYPFLSGLFPSLGWGPFYSTSLHKYLLTVSPLETRMGLDLVLGVWRVFGDTVSGSPGLFAILPFAFLAARGRPAVLLKLASVAVYLLWLTTERGARFLLPLVPWTAALAGGLLEAETWSIVPGRPMNALSSAARWFPRFRIALALAVTFLALIRIPLFVPAPDWIYLAGQMDRDSLLTERFSTWNRVRLWVNGRMTPRDRVLFTCEARRIWFVPQVLSTHPVTEPIMWKIAGESLTASEFRKKIRQRGITHLLHNFISAEYRGIFWFEGPAWTDRMLYLYKDFMKQYARPVYIPDRVDHFNGGYYVFSMEPTPSRKPYPLYYLPYIEGRFRNAYHTRSYPGYDAGLLEARRVAQPIGDVYYVQHNLASFLWDTGKIEAVAALLKPGVEAGYIGDSSITKYGFALLSSGKSREAIKALKQAWNVYRNSDAYRGAALALDVRGVVLHNQKKYREALGYFDKAAYLLTGTTALQYKPGQAPGEQLNQCAVLNMHASMALAAMGRFNEAVAFIRRAEELAPNDAEIRTFAFRLETDAAAR
jgi:tetratricopeptide (TPR) repeat protein